MKESYVETWIRQIDQQSYQALTVYATVQPFFPRNPSVNAALPFCAEKDVRRHAI